MKVKIIVITFAIIAVVAIGIALPGILSNKDATIVVDYARVKADFKDEMIKAIAVIDDPEAVNGTNASSGGESSTLGAVVDSNEEIQGNNLADKEASLAATDEKTTFEMALDEAETPMGNPSSYVNAQFIDQKIQENIEKIEEADLQRGVAIYESLDSDYLFAFLENGLTEEEKVSIDNYLKSKLTGTDYEVAKVLYYKYADLMND